MTEMVGKRQLNRARKREAIVEIATRAFFCNGYAATSMSAIADELGGSKATLWAHFSSKEDLFAAVIDREIESFSALLTPTLVDREFSLPALRQAAISFLECLLRPSSVQLYRVILSECERFPEISEMFYSRGPLKMRAAMIDFFKTSFPEDVATRCARLLITGISGYRSDILIRPDKPSAADRAFFIEQLIAAIIPTAPLDGVTEARGSQPLSQPNATA